MIAARRVELQPNAAPATGRSLPLHVRSMMSDDMNTASKWRERRGPLAGAAAAVVALVAGAAVVLAHGNSGSGAPHAGTKARSAPPSQIVQAATVLPSSLGSSRSTPSTSRSSTSRSATRGGGSEVVWIAPPPTPRRHGPRTAITHVPVATLSDATGGVAVRFNGDPAPNTPRPALSPRVKGEWTNIGPYEVFRPVSTLEPCTSYTMTVPADTFVLRHRMLGAARTISFAVGCPGITALQEALARLDYLPYGLRGFVGASSASALTRKQAARRAYVLPHAKLRPSVRGAPPLVVGTMDATTTGALEVFEGDHGLPLTTTPSKALWVKLLADETLGRNNPKPYTWVTVTKTIPETLEVHEGSKIALSSPTNTGVPGADTQTGIFPIYLRYVATTMIGTNVDGSHYDDPGVPWVNYFNGGDAVHGYLRPGYGYPQSNGCVELPISTSQTVYGMLALGDLVIVE
jgi:L,D-transpeptidase catalytic domain